MDIKFEVNGKIDKLASSMGVSTENMWDIMIMQAKVVAVQWVVAWVILVVTTALVFKLKKKYKGIDCAYDVELVMNIVAYVLLTATFTVALLGAFEIPGLLMNPEFYILEKVLVIAGS